MMRQTPQPTDPGSSEPVSETESGCESADPLAPETVRMLRLELEGERRQNKQLQAKLKRAAKLNEQLVRTAAWPDWLLVVAVEMLAGSGCHHSS